MIDGNKEPVICDVDLTEDDILRGKPSDVFRHR